ncbi:MAG: DUF1949 domain-containing protein [Winogradskyella sp.]|uniref:IMPACT family protein n=1 Tax=Winogradskyella sp. TaxID=1883156 RepID=UPI000F40BBA6|nr:YigZ family protein [Winogradskyella sp.]RNC79773.1 MAG: DUF1949 domain-containing protein [Winogradskyella sp.]
MATLDTYKTISKPSQEVLFKDKNSKFYGFAFPIISEDDVKHHIETLKKKHYNARHWCYAYQLGIENIRYRANDDGEPNNSAGMPIYGQIQSFEVTNILIVVVRYFGGVKLGVSGLINAYRTAAQMALEDAEIIEKTVDSHFNLTFDYKDLSKVQRIIKDYGAGILNQKFEADCEIKFAIRKSKSDEIFNYFENFYGVTVKRL